jgi:fermentation-respiration switch protein FrsA (DUF1100 family)
LPVSALLRDRYPSLERINAGVLDGVPTLVIAGTSDGTVPFDQSMQIAGAVEAATYVVEGADHNDPAIRSAAELIDTVARFVDRAIGE